MSGASGLSAAKRRRAGSNISLDNNNSNNRGNNGNNGNNTRLRIQDVVIDHERRIQDFEKLFTTMTLSPDSAKFSIEVATGLSKTKE